MHSSRRFSKTTIPDWNVNHLKSTIFCSNPLKHMVKMDTSPGNRDLIFPSLINSVEYFCLQTHFTGRKFFGRRPNSISLRNERNDKKCPNNRTGDLWGTFIAVTSLFRQGWTTRLAFRITLRYGSIRKHRTSTNSDITC